MQRIHRYGLEVVGLLFFFFAVHRGLAWSFLADALGQAPLLGLQALAVGLASDLWVAALGSLVLLGGLGLSRLSHWRFDGPLTIAYALIFGILVSVHQSYVEFFHAPLLTLHLPYMLDPLFVTANYGSLLTPRPLVLAAILLTGLVVASYRLTRLPRWSARKSALVLLAVYLGAVGAHVFNIRYRIQWFVPEALQMNLFESLYTQSRSQRPAIEPGEAEWSLLQERLAGQPPAPALRLTELLLLSAALPAANAGAAGLQPTLAELMRQRWQELIAAQRKPLLVVILAESLRALDSASYGGQRPSLTPHFDELARTGILFRNAWSTGTVTRAGQEAVWCGYLGNMSNSMMRTYTQIKMACVPDMSPAASFWYHGGEGRFDNQAHFWRKHQVADLMTQADFAKTAARTGWGVGDRTFLQAAAKRIVQRDRQAEELPYQLGMLLTVSHHIPWQLPSDAPASLAEAPYRGLHASEQTLAYSDFALGEFVTALKLAGLWEKTILVVAGDHGILAPPLQDVDEEHSGLAAVQKSKIALVVAGGLIEELSTSDQWPEGDSRVREEHVSQADIAGLIGFVTGLTPSPLLGGEPLLHGKRRRPVVADLGSSVFFPALGVELDLATVAAAPLADFADPELRYGLAYYRAVSQVIRQWSLGQQPQREASAAAVGSRP